MKYLFVCGTPRSGTTAMWRLLTSDNRICLGVERYGNLFFEKPLTKNLFTKDRFLTYEKGDTFYNDLSSFNNYYDRIEKNFNGYEVVGDKIPLLYKYIERTLASIPEAKIVIMIRNIFDIAASYEARAANKNDDSWSRDKRTASAIQDWRDMLKVIDEFSNDTRIKPVIFEDFFNDQDNNCNLEKLYKFIDLPVNEDNICSFSDMVKQSESLKESRVRRLDDTAIQLICETAPFGLYRQVIKKVRDEY